MEKKNEAILISNVSPVQSFQNTTPFDQLSDEAKAKVETSLRANGFLNETDSVARIQNLDRKELIELKLTHKQIGDALTSAIRSELGTTEHVFGSTPCCFGCDFTTSSIFALTGLQTRFDEMLIHFISVHDFFGGGAERLGPATVANILKLVSGADYSPVRALKWGPTDEATFWTALSVHAGVGWSVRIFSGPIVVVTNECDAELRFVIEGYELAVQAKKATKVRLVWKGS